MGKTQQNKGKFPVYPGNTTPKRFNPPPNDKAESSLAQNKGEFPVKTSKGSPKRFNPPRP